MSALPGAIVYHRSAVLLDLLFSAYTTLGSVVFLILDGIGAKRSGKSRNWLKILNVLVPLVLVVVFFLIYKNMNPLFEKFTEDISLDFISMEWVWFTLGGLLLIYSLFRNRRISRIDNWNQNRPIEIDQVGLSGPRWNEFMGFSILFVVLNLMLLVVNGMDLNYLYLGAGMPESVTHKAFVHKGVGMLIFSIFLGITILLFFFRGFLNYVEKSKFAKWLAFAWIAQNAFMVISTAIRNTMYIDQALLSYKRIGVYFWLFFALIGLATTLIKLHKNKTSWYLVRNNLIAVFTVFVLSSAVDWDGLISSFNLGRTMKMEEISAVDKNYMLSLSAGNIAGLYAIKDMPGFEVDSAYSYQPDRFGSNRAWLDYNIYSFLRGDLEGDWRSYSARRSRVRKEIMGLHNSGMITSMNLAAYGRITTFEPLLALSNLVELNLEGNYGFSKSVLPGINQMQNLETLDLSRNYLQKLDTLELINSLKVLALTENRIEDLNFLGNYPNLDSLELGQNKIISLATLPELKALRSLNLDFNPLTDILGLAGLPGLKNLSLDRVDKHVGKFPPLVGLEVLSMSESKAAIYHGFRYIAELPSLVELDVSSNQLRNLELLFTLDLHDCKTPNLKSLEIGDNWMVGLKGIEVLEHLEYLGVGGNKLSRVAGIEQLVNLKKLDLSGNVLQNLAFLGEMGRLTKLNLADNVFLRSYTPLSGLNNLTSLNLSGTHFTELEQIGAQGSLQFLWLDGCRISSWESLSKFQAIEEMSVSYLTMEDVAIFKQLNTLEHLYVKETEKAVLELLRKELNTVTIN
ncbi:MAG: DUF4173 domain-containing protein [Flavobacteriales bacterium]|nr:DUF4173 domain-containing protein [Flavobacteriales bacterium]